MKSSFLLCLFFCAFFVADAVAGQAEDQVLAKERSLWAAFQKHDGELYRKSVTADSVQVIANSTPVVGRDAIAKMMSDPECTLRSFDLSDVKAHRLAPTVVMLTYLTKQDGGCGKDALVSPVHSTAIYVLQKGEWLERYYQETPAK
jgi:hypothetical protein